MAKDMATCNDIIPDTGGAAGVGADFGGDLAGNKGVDLNAGRVSKATMMSYDTPLPEDYSGMTVQAPDSAIYAEAPEHAGRTPEQVVAEMQEAWDYAGPANENEYEGQQPYEAEYGDSPE